MVYQVNSSAKCLEGAVLNWCEYAEVVCDVKKEPVRTERVQS